MDLRGCAGDTVKLLEELEEGDKIKTPPKKPRKPRRKTVKSRDQWVARIEKQFEKSMAKDPSKKAKYEATLNEAYKKLEEQKY